MNTKTFALFLMVTCLLLLPLVANGGQATFSWDSVDADDLAGYRLYMSDTSGSYTGPPDLLKFPWARKRKP